MKTILFKTALILLLGFAFIQNSDAQGGYYYRDCGPRYYAHPRYEQPRYVPAPRYYGRVVVPGHFIIDRFGRRIWVRPYCR